MATRAQKIRLGIFVIVSSLALISLIAFFTSERYLHKKDTYYIAYQDVSVSGLEAGSPVKYLGLKVGTIEEITIDPQDVSRIIVEVSLKEGTPIKEDAEADIVSLGITGLKMLEIRGASKEAPLLDEGNFIQAGSAEEITGKAEVLAEKMERVFTNLQKFTQEENLEKITQMIESAGAAFAETEALLNENRREIHETLVAARGITARLDSTGRIVQDSATRIRSIIYSDTLSQIIASTRDISLKLKEANLGNLIGELGDVVERTNQLLLRINQDVERGSSDFLTSMNELRTTLQNLNEASILVQEDPSVLIRGTNVSNAPDKHLER